MIEMDFSDAPAKPARREHDAYMTPSPLAEAIVARLAATKMMPTPHRIVEPACGDGDFVKAIRAAWPQAAVYAVDIRPDVRPRIEALGAKFIAKDFLDVPREALGECDLIVSNPPFFLFREFVGHALDGMRDGAWLALLIRLGHLVGSAEAQAWWTTPRVDGGAPIEHLARVLPIHPRPSFTGRGTDSQEYGLAIWIKGARIGDFSPIKWNKPKRKSKNGA